MSNIPDIIELPEAINRALTVAGDEMAKFGHSVGADHSKAFTARQQQLASEAGQALRWAISQALTSLATPEAQMMAHVRAFIEKQRIDCAETVGQSDRVIVNAYEFIEGCCKIAGYHVYPEDAGVVSDNPYEPAAHPRPAWTGDGRDHQLRIGDEPCPLRVFVYPNGSRREPNQWQWRADWSNANVADGEIEAKRDALTTVRAMAEAVLSTGPSAPRQVTRKQVEMWGEWFIGQDAFGAEEQVRVLLRELGITVDDTTVDASPKEPPR
jgi:hypothetical protein